MRLGEKKRGLAAKGRLQGRESIMTSQSREERHLGRSHGPAGKRNFSLGGGSKPFTEHEVYSPTRTRIHKIVLEIRSTAPPLKRKKRYCYQGGMKSEHLKSRKIQG